MSNATVRAPSARESETWPREAAASVAGSCAASVAEYVAELPRGADRDLPAGLRAQWCLAQMRFEHIQRIEQMNKYTGRSAARRFKTPLGGAAE
jgi:hypothetical protein